MTNTTDKQMMTIAPTASVTETTEHNVPDVTDDERGRLARAQTLLDAGRDRLAWIDWPDAWSESEGWMTAPELGAALPTPSARSGR